MRYLLCLGLFGVATYAQTTTISSSSTITDRQGNLMTGTTCWGIYSTSNGVTTYNPTGGCYPFTVGVQSSYTVTNGTYNIWINETSPVTALAGSQSGPLFQIAGITLSGTTISVGTYLQSQFGVSIGGTYNYPTLVNQANLALTCAGNAVVLPGSPQDGYHLSITNTSATACPISGGTITGNGTVNSIPGNQSWIATWSAALSDWLVSHIGT